MKQMRKKKSASPVDHLAGMMDGFLDWMESDAGQVAMEVSDAVHGVLNRVKLDVKRRLFIWSDGKQLDFAESSIKIEEVTRIKDASVIYDHMISWMEMEYTPDDIDTNDAKAMDRFEKKINDWIASV